MKCAHCKVKPGTRSWAWKLCAFQDYRDNYLWLCDDCDIKANRIMVEFFGLPQGRRIVAAYRKHVRRTAKKREEVIPCA